MFSGKKQESVNLDKIDTLVGAGTEFNGTLVAKGTLRVDGKVEGKIITEGDVVVGEGGNIIADIEARNIVISGEIRGNIIASSSLELMPTGKVYGDISVKNLQIADGAVFEGKCDMTGNKANTKKEKSA